MCHFNRCIAISLHGSLVFFPANRHDTQTVESTLTRRIKKEKDLPLYADKGYDSYAVRQSMQHHGYIDRVGVRGKIVHRVVNRRRNIVERFFSWLDKSRRLIVRYDFYVTSYAAWTWLACLKIIHLFAQANQFC